MNKINENRINKELYEFNSEKDFEQYSSNIQNYFRSLNIEVYITNNDKNNNDLYNLKITNKNSNNNILECHIPNAYPFKPYLITKFKIINNTGKFGYHKYLSLINSKNNKIYDNKIIAFFYKLQYGCESRFLNLSDTSCFCCSSITCSHNWMPSFKINNILLEYLEAQFIINYNQPYNYIKISNIYYKLFEIFDHYYNLPPEIITIILSYC